MRNEAGFFLAFYRRNNGGLLQGRRTAFTRGLCLFCLALQHPAFWVFSHQALTSCIRLEHHLGDLHLHFSRGWPTNFGHETAE